jgi:hypothetical protein
MTAIMQGYHDTPIQILPQEDVALIVWGNIVTGDVSVPLRFHASKTVARKYLQQQKHNKWMAKQFEEVNWEHLDLALKNKGYNYKIWRSKETSRFCGTRSQVKLHSGDTYPDKRCPNCGSKEMDAHLMQCSDKDHTRLLINNVDNLTKWLEKDRIMAPKLVYWIPKYILMRNDKPFLQLDYMSPQLRPLAESQDKIGWRNFTEGYILTQRYNVQKFHLAMANSYLN